MSLLDSFAEAVERCDLSKVTSLIGSGSIDVNARLRVGFNFDINRAVPALVIAAARNHTELVGILLQSGAHIDDVDSCGRTACHFAVSHRNANMMALLLTHRPNLEIKSTSARKVTPLQISLADYQCTRISLMLLEAGASLKGVRKSHLCHFAASSTSAIQSLLNRGYVMSELRNDDACTPLHAAALQASCDSAAVNMLINVCGVDLEARNAAGLTCMQCTAVQSNVDALRCFVHAGADLTCVNQQGMTLLHCVRDYNCTLLLLAARADVNVRDRHGKTACHSALPTANWRKGVR